MRDRDLRLIPVVAVLLIMLAGCTPADTITEIEDGENGTKVETQDDREWYLREDLACEVGDQLWVCASREDLLVERGGSRG